MATLCISQHIKIILDFIQGHPQSMPSIKVSLFKHSKGTVQFRIDKPIPLDLVRKIVRFRVKKNIESGKKKK